MTNQWLTSQRLGHHLSALDHCRTTSTLSSWLDNVQIWEELQQFWVPIKSDNFINRKLAGNKLFQIDLFAWCVIFFSSWGFSRPTVPERRTWRKDLLWASPFPPLLLSSPLSLCPVFRPLFLFLLCSSRVVLSGPVLPETPSTSTLAIFSIFPFRLLYLSFSSSLSILTFTLSAPLSIPQTSNRLKRGAILNPGQVLSYFGCRVSPTAS